MVNLICSDAVNAEDVNCLPVTGASIETAFTLLSKMDKVQTPVAGKADLDTDLLPFTVPFFALTPNQYVVALFKPGIKYVRLVVLPMMAMVSAFSCHISYEVAPLMAGQSSCANPSQGMVAVTTG